MRKHIIVFLLCSIWSASSRASVEYSADSAGVKFVKSPQGTVLEMGLLSRGIKSKRSESYNTYYTAWCIGGNVFLATKRWNSNDESKIIVHPFTDNLTTIIDKGDALPCVRFKGVRKDSFDR